MLADGGDCLSDLAVLRDQPELFGPVASTPTAWRVVERLAQDPDGLARLRAARAHARARAWAAGAHPDLELLIVDADATLVLAHSDAKQGAAGHLQGIVRVPSAAGLPGPRPGPGEPLAGILRPGNAPAGAADDLIELVDLALAQLPAAAAGPAGPGPQRQRRGQHPAGLAPPRRPGVGFSLGMPIDAHLREAILAQPERGLDPSDRRRRPAPRRRRGVRADRLDRPAHLAGGHPGDLPARGRPPRRPAALHRPRRAPLPGLPHRPARPRPRPAGAAAPPARPGRGPHPRRQGHRPAQPPL